MGTWPPNAGVVIRPGQTGAYCTFNVEKHPWRVHGLAPDSIALPHNYFTIFEKNIVELLPPPVGIWMQSTRRVISAS